MEDWWIIYLPFHALASLSTAHRWSLRLVEFPLVAVLVVETWELGDVALVVVAGAAKALTQK